MQVRAALDAALGAVELHLLLQTLLASMHAMSPPPLTALAVSLWLVHALTAAIGGGWGGADAAQWALQASLQSIGVVLRGGGGRLPKAQSEAVLVAAFEPCP